LENFDTFLLTPSSAGMYIEFKACYFDTFLLIPSSAGMFMEFKACYFDTFLLIPSSAGMFMEFKAYTCYSDSRRESVLLISGIFYKFRKNPKKLRKLFSYLLNMNGKY